MAKKAKSKSSIDIADLLMNGPDEYESKISEAEERLSNSLCMFTVIQGSPCFIYGGMIEPLILSYGDFVCFCIANSNVDLEDGASAIREFNRFITNEFSAEDFRFTAAMDCLSHYLKAILDEKGLPRALAFECFIYDKNSNVIIRVEFTGDFDIHSLSEVEDSASVLFGLGGYGSKSSKSFISEFEALVKKHGNKLDAKMLEEGFARLAKRLKLPCCSISVVK